MNETVWQRSDGQTLTFLFLLLKLYKHKQHHENQYTIMACMQLPTRSDGVASSATVQLAIVKVCGNPGVFVVVLVGADAQSFLVADCMSIVQSDALSPVQSDASIDVACWRPALCHRSVNRVLQSPTSIREPVRYLNRSNTSNVDCTKSQTCNEK